MDAILNRWKVIITIIIAVLTFTTGIVVWVDSRYAHSDTVIELQLEVQLTKLNQLSDQSMFEYYRLLSATEKSPNNTDIKKSLIAAEKRMNDIDVRVNALKMKMGI